MRIESIFEEYWRIFQWFGRGLNRLFSKLVDFYSKSNDYRFRFFFYSQSGRHSYTTLSTAVPRSRGGAHERCMPTRCRKGLLARSSLHHTSRPATISDSQLWCRGASSAASRSARSIFMSASFASSSFLFASAALKSSSFVCASSTLTSSSFLFVSTACASSFLLAAAAFSDSSFLYSSAAREMSTVSGLARRRHPSS
jgi:hypothetical protein